MGTPEGKEGRPDSAASEERLEAYEVFGDPGTWGLLEPLGIGLRLLVARPWTWIGLALVGLVGWGLVVGTVVGHAPDPDHLLLAGLPVGMYLALRTTWDGHQLLAEGPAARLAPRSWASFSRLGALLALPLVLGVLLWGAACLAYGILGARAPWAPAVDGLLFAVAFRAGAFALQEVLLAGAGPFEALRESWRLTGSLRDGLFMPAMLYATSLLAATALWLVFAFAFSFPATRPLGELGLPAVMGAGQLVMIWSGLVWTSHYVAVKKRSLR